ncbi:hypothetical protein WS71_30735 [Burkholderia mayonis]|uniref:Uncharacterized protein n=1 Tax=Burkholderia mayonis TaxID=1385591 RepID=A0A1B4G694_9BURK|nr:hypothetical protein WS71_30735 [Burkholderia mayonis]
MAAGSRHRADRAAAAASSKRDEQHPVSRASGFPTSTAAAASFARSGAPRSREHAALHFPNARPRMR